MLKGSTTQNAGNDAFETARRIRLSTFCGSPLKLDHFLELAAGIAEAVAELHQRHIVHRHLNPSQILIDQETGTIVLADPSSQDLTPTLALGNFAGEVDSRLAVAYLSPEQLGRINQLVDFRSDLYSLGATLYELLTGRPPFLADDLLEWVHCHIARTPMPPIERNPATPPVVSDIVMKLLAKSVEERYQTAAGLRLDLQRCLERQRNGLAIEAFPLAEGDISDQLLVPGKLYGRQSDIELLTAAFHRVEKRYTPEIIMISGYSGIGKTSLVRELYRPVALEHGFFISGKFEQFKRNTPYATIIEAFQGLIRHILTEQEVRLADWKQRLLEALGTNARLIVDIIPQVELIIGAQPPVPELSIAEAENRFNLVFSRFVGVFSRKQQPLVMFLDDLQWADAASLKLIQHLILDSDTGCLLIIGAYRDNEVDSAHPLTATIAAMQGAGAAVRTLALQPLSFTDLDRLLADILRSTRARREPLTRLIYEKTGGNPFFVIQFLRSLHDEGLIAFEVGSRQWQWDVARIRAKDSTDNVVDLMTARILKLPAATIDGLRLAACLGNEFDLSNLDELRGAETGATEKALHVAVKEMLLVASGTDRYAFVHDRVHQAAYFLNPANRREALHLRIGRLMLARTDPEAIDEVLFDIVNQYNLGAALITDRKERYRVTELALAAGRKAKASTAYASAWEYLSVGRKLLDETIWHDRFLLGFALYRELAETQYLRGNACESKELLTMLLDRAQTELQRAEIFNMLINQCTLLGRYEEAITFGRTALRTFDVCIPESGFAAAVPAEMRQYNELLAGQSISSLIDAAEMTDPRNRACLELLANLLVPARYTDNALFALIAVIAVNFSLRCGPTAKSTVGYTAFAMVLQSQYNKHRDAYDFGKLALRISERFNNPAQKCQASLVLGHYLTHWVHHLKAADAILDEGFREGVAVGERQWTGYIMAYKLFQPFYRGVAIEKLREEMPAHLSYARKTRNRWALDTLTGLELVLGLLAGTGEPSLESTIEQYTEKESAYLTECEAHRSFGALGRYLVLRAQTHLMYGEPGAGMEAAARARELAEFFSSSISEAALNFYESLLAAALFTDGTPEIKELYLKRIETNLRQMRTWTDHCQENFLHQYLLVEAEHARIDERPMEAQTLYEQAILAAKAHGFVQHQALASECAARFYRQQQLATCAQAYLRHARECYLRWGAVGKVRQLDRLLPPARQTEDAGGRIAAAQIGNLDAIAVVKASQAISGEIVLSELVKTLMRTVLENAGAQKGCLILIHNNEMRIEAQAEVTDREIHVLQPRGVDLNAVLPLSMLNYVRRTRETLILEEAVEETMFHTDPYILHNRPVSVLCLPLLRQARMIGMLYLENSLVKGAFTRERIAVLEVLTAQAAISLENAALYQQRSRAEQALRESEEKYRAIFEDSGTPLIFIEEDKTISICNKAFEKLSGYTRQEMEGHGKWTDIVAHQEDVARMSEYHRRRRIDPLSVPESYKFELIDRAGRLKDVVATVAMIQGTTQSLCALLDITREVQLEKELRQAHKMEAIGTLAGGIAHDFNNILAVIQGHSQLMELKLEESDPMRHSLGQILVSCTRARDLVRQILTFSRLSDHEMKPVQMTDLVEEVAKMLRSSLPATVEIALAIEVPPERSIILADAIQIHQVLMNLATNGAHAMGSGGGVLEIRLSETTMPSGAPDAAEVAPGNYLRLSVTDSGQGMDTATIERIFDPYFTTKGPGEGSGMGLAVTRGIVKAHRGAIQVVSQPGVGTTFHVYLPQNKGDAGKQTEPIQPLPTGRERILFVDDESQLADLGAQTLRMLGYRVTTEKSARKALETFQAKPLDFDLVITDMTMPKLSGMELAEKLLAIRPELPIIICTGFSNLVDEKKFKSLSIREILMKPCAIGDLAAAIRRALQQHDEDHA